MKKLFVSVPMKGCTEEEIKESINKMHRIAEAYEDEKLELIDSYVAESPPLPDVVKAFGILVSQLRNLLRQTYLSGFVIRLVGLVVGLRLT